MNRVTTPFILIIAILASSFLGCSNQTTNESPSTTAPNSDVVAASNDSSQANEESPATVPPVANVPQATTTPSLEEVQVRRSVDYYRLRVWLNNHSDDTTARLRQALVLEDSFTAMFEVTQTAGDSSIEANIYNSTYSFHSVVVVHNVTLENIEQKRNEIVAIAATDYRQEYARFLQGLRFLQQPITSPSIVPQNIQTPLAAGATVGYGAFPYTSIWVQLPPAANQSMGIFNGRMHWLRTQVQFDGAVRPQNGANTAVMVSSLVTDIFEISTSSSTLSLRGITGLLKVGTIRANLRSEEGQPNTARVDLDFIGLTYSDSIGLGRLVAFYFSAAMRVGVRIVEQNKAQFRAVYGQDMRLGLLFANHFFVDGGFSYNSESGYNNVVNLFGSLGWKFTDMVTARATLNYSFPGADLVNESRDHMYLVPEGLSGNASIALRF